MRCLFCKKVSDTSRSVEHILPESLGNLTHTLSRGIICDNCNNYFARKVEKPFQDLPAIKTIRFHESVPSKKGIIPAMDAVLLPGIPAVLRKDKEGPFLGSIELPTEGINYMLEEPKSTIVFPVQTPSIPNGPIVSRFLSKVALEAMGKRLEEYPAGLEYLVDEEQLDPIRNHARWGETIDWKFSIRRIYNEDKQWTDKNGKSFQVIHEWDILQTQENEWYFILVLFGLELTINYGAPDISGYLRWLQNHNNISPLYWGKNNNTSDYNPNR